MKITLVRHGEVEEAYHACYNGHIDISLSPKGRLQAEELAKAFKTTPFDAVFCSDLKRCKETLEAFELNAKPIYTKALREKSWGRHEGMRFEQILASESFEYENFEQWITALDGESYPLYIERIAHFFTDLSLNSTYANVLVMTHAGVIRVLMHILQKISLEEAFGQSFAYAGHLLLDTEGWRSTEKTKGFGEIQCV